MKPEEFEGSVLSAFTECFPSTVAWLGDMPDAGRELLRTWYGELAGHDASAVISAIRRIRAGKQIGPEECDRRSWPGFILKAIREWSDPDPPPDFTKPRNRNRCQVCDDMGSVPCFSVDALERVLAAPGTTDDEILLMPAHYIQCTCDKGKRYWIYRDGRPPRPLPQFDAERAVRISQGVGRLRRFISEKGFRLHDWYESKWTPKSTEEYESFAAWSGTQD